VQKTGTGLKIDESNGKTPAFAGRAFGFSSILRVRQLSLSSVW
jgi:hypothetical protein